jgi:hypothetical protein
MGFRFGRHIAQIAGLSRPRRGILGDDLSTRPLDALRPAVSCSLTSHHALDVALHGTARSGFAHVPSLLGTDTCERLLSCLAGWPLSDAPAQVGRVSQRARMAVIPAERWEPLAALVELVAHLHTGLATSGWIPNEATIMCYEGEGSGISSHRDNRRFGLLVAILSLAGRGRVTILTDRAGERPLADLDCRPGDLVLLRGAGLADPDDGSDPRPLHAVDAPAAGRRVSLTFRMDTTVIA